jgi:transcriptional regulator with XRE-family HTH domain
LNPTQEEFIRLMAAAGWSDAETARRINVSRAAISQIRKGKNTPEVTLERLRLAVANQPLPVVENVKSSARAAKDEVAELRWRLEYLASHDRQAFAITSALIDTLYERAKAVSSSPADVARAVLAEGVAAVERLRPAASGRFRAVASPNAPASPREPDAPAD